ncbi:DUF6708 domain-containing protein [Pseudomonas sp. CC120222-01a]|uniref:DUF6708 domain-containing protein n=1 Tax=Pseudomonas sp. CC120222-01a TaxID=1378075 RepID=UPI000D89A6D7|nr:DUF6708 domain-containing protein [Pseudomonas sp. CC120222-01a]PVZ42752.1 hypothetical protein N430_01365 [Pseudomonas sp. CC120222-01a]
METPSRGIGWKYDLPSPQIKAALDLEVKNLLKPVSDMNENYIELSRTTLKARGYWIIGSILISAVALTGTIQSLYYFPPEPNLTGLKQLSFFMLIYLIIACFITPYIRMEFGLPQDEPIRFNRHRRKVYFYQYRFNFLKPFGKKNWGVIPVAYDWDDLTLEAYRIYAPMGNGGLKEEVKISICKPGTNEIIDRVFFYDDIEEGEQYWAIVRLFMQQGPEAIPDFLHPSNNKDENPSPNTEGKIVFRNPFNRLGPEVNWPAEMDLESRTAPIQAEQP